MAKSRAEIDALLIKAMDEAGLKQYQIAWSSRPAEIKCLVGDDMKRAPIGTRLSKHALDTVLDQIAAWGRMQDQHRAAVRERGRV